MRLLRTSLAGLLLCAPALLGAQEPDSVTRARARADSVGKAVRDSIALMKALGAALADSSATVPPAASTGPQAGAANPRLLPDISAVGDFVGDLSPRGSTQPDQARFSIREVELAVQSVVDPYFRGDVFLGISDAEGISIEQAILTTTALPNQLEAKIGRFLLPFGKQNLTHRHDLHTTEYPYVIQRFLSDDGLKGSGILGSRVFSPFGFFQEVNLVVMDRLSTPTAGLTTAEPVNRSLAGLGYMARLRNYVDISEAANVELSFSGMTGKREQPLDSATTTFVNDVNAVAARQSTVGADLTYRWRPLQQGLYRSFILQAEVMRQMNEQPSTGMGCAIRGACGYAGPARDFTGAYLFARVQTGQRSFIGSRYDFVQDPENDGRTLNAGSVYLEWFPSEFSKLSAGYEGVSSKGRDLVNRLLLQATFSLGPHKPHPF